MSCDTTLSPFLMNECGHIDHAGHLIAPVYVDLRKPSDRLPITTLIKSCKREHMIGFCKKILISKPEVFRESGEGSLADPLEAKAIKTIPGRTDDSGMPEAPSKETLTTGKNGWIYCTSIEPTNQEETNKWQNAMPEEYDHYSYILRPRQFARALGSMVAEHLGPRGKEEILNHAFDGKHKIKTKHKTQLILHGPVIYEENPYDVIFSSPIPFEYMARSVFIKRMKYRDEREYRFAIWTEKEPLEKQVKLDISLAMLESTQGYCGGTIPQVLPTVVPSEQPPKPNAARADHNETSTEGPVGPRILSTLLTEASYRQFFMDRVNDPLIPITPNTYGDNELPSDLHEMVTTYAALRALRDRIEMSTRSGKLDGKSYVRAASSAWHAEPLIRRLCSKFEDPVKEISLDGNNFVIIAVKFPDGRKPSGSIGVGPEGAGIFTPNASKPNMTFRSSDVRLLDGSIEKELKEAGIRTRGASSAPSSGSPQRSD